MVAHCVHEITKERFWQRWLDCKYGYYEVHDRWGSDIYMALCKIVPFSSAGLISLSESRSGSTQQFWQ